MRPVWRCPPLLRAPGARLRSTTGTIPTPRQAARGAGPSSGARPSARDAGDAPRAARQPVRGGPWAALRARRAETRGRRAERLRPMPPGARGPPEPASGGAVAQGPRARPYCAHKTGLAVARRTTACQGSGREGRMTLTSSATATLGARPGGGRPPAETADARPAHERPISPADSGDRPRRARAVTRARQVSRVGTLAVVGALLLPAAPLVASLGHDAQLSRIGHFNRGQSMAAADARHAGGVPDANADAGSLREALAQEGVAEDARRVEPGGKRTEVVIARVELAQHGG